MAEPVIYSIVGVIILTIIFSPLHIRREKMRHCNARCWEIIACLLLLNVGVVTNVIACYISIQLIISYDNLVYMYNDLTMPCIYSALLYFIGTILEILSLMFIDRPTNADSLGISNKLITPDIGSNKSIDQSTPSSCTSYNYLLYLSILTGVIFTCISYAVGISELVKIVSLGICGASLGSLIGLIIYSEGSRSEGEKKSFGQD